MRACYEGHNEIIECSIHQKSSGRSREMPPCTLCTSLTDTLSCVHFVLTYSQNYVLVIAPPPIAKCHNRRTAPSYLSTRTGDCDWCHCKRDSANKGESCQCCECFELQYPSIWCELIHPCRQGRIGKGFTATLTHN